MASVCHSHICTYIINHFPRVLGSRYNYIPDPKVVSVFWDKLAAQGELDFRGVV